MAERERERKGSGEDENAPLFSTKCPSESPIHDTEILEYQRVVLAVQYFLSLRYLSPGIILFMKSYFVCCNQPFSVMAQSCFLFWIPLSSLHSSRDSFFFCGKQLHLSRAFIN